MLWKDHTSILQLIYKTPTQIWTIRCLLKTLSLQKDVNQKMKCKPKIWFHCVGMNKMRHKLEGAPRLLVIQECRYALDEQVIQCLTGTGDKGTAAPQYQQPSDLQEPAQTSDIGYQIISLLKARPFLYMTLKKRKIK